ncbi:MAG: beta strand repeat-containing protein, partial [Planctomycetota bacterium]
RGLVTLLAGNVYVPAGGIIANGIAAAASGDTVNLAPTTFTENVSIAKRITLSGAGSGAGGTALVSAAGTGTPVISVTGSGINGDNQLTIKNLSMAGTSNTSGSDAIAVYGDAPVSFVKVDNVNISAHGVAVHYRSGTVTNATVSNSTLSGNGFAVRVASAVTTMDGMTIDGCTMNNNNSSAISTNPSGTLSNINTNFTVSNSTFANNSTAGVANEHDLSFFGFRGNATLQNVTVTSGNGTSQNSNSHGVVFSGNSGFQTLGTVVLDNVTVQGHVGKNAMTFQAYANVGGVSMNNVSLQNCVTGWGVDLTVSSNGAAPLDIGNTRLKTVGTWNASGVDAEDAVFYTAGGSVLNRSVLADNYTISSQIKADAIDIAGLGLVRTDANDLYVSLLSFASPYTTLSGALERAITASRTGDTINVENGVPVVLTAPITKSILFAGNFLITSSSIPTGSSATAVLSSFVSRVAAGSTIAVNATGMTTDQLAAVAAAMPGNVDNLVITAADAPADITALLAQAVVGAEYPRVEMAGMSRAQTAAVNGSLNKVAVVNGSKVRVARGASTVHYDLYVDPAAAAAQADDVMTVDAGSYALLQKIEVDGWSLVGAGSALVTIDMSAAPMNTAQGSREQGILLSGDGASVSGFTLTSPTRTASTGSAYGIKSGGTNIAISNVAVNNVALSAVDLNGAVGGTIDGLSVNGVSGGFGLAISGATSDITVSNITVLNAAWGEVAAFPYLAGVPSDIEFTTGLNINAITIQPATSSLSATVPAGNAYHSASAGVKVPAAFNRQIGLPTNGVSVTRLVTRQGSVAGLQAYMVTLGVPLAAQTVTNILGPAEQVRGGVALAGVSVLDDAFAASLAAGDVVQMNLATTGGTIALTTAFPATSSIVGTFTLTSTSYPNATTLDAILAASGTASRTVVMTNTNATQTAAVAAQVGAIGLGNIQDALYPINAAASGAEMTNSLTVAGIIPNAEYNALTSGRKAAVATDTQANRPSAGYASVAATGELCGQVTHFRTAQQPIIDGTSLAAADFGSSGRYTALVAAVDGLTAGTTLTGETASVYNSSTVASQFAALVDGGRGEAYVLAAMNSNDSSISSMNDAFAASIETAQAYDALDAGITSANSASNITYLFGFATANSVAVNASGMDDGQLGAVSNGIGFVSAITNLSLASSENATEIGNLLSKTSGALASATGMDQGQLSALGAGASAIAGNGITGTLLVDKTVTSLNALLGKTAAGATVNVNASLMSDAYLTILSGNISKIDEITSLALTSAQSAEEIANLLTEAVAAVADATGMDQTELSNLGAAAPAIADNGITGTLAIESTINNLNALLGKTAAGATVNVNAASMSDANLTVLSGQIAKVDEITSLALTSAQSAEEIANLLTKAVAAVANATGMDEAKLSNLGAAAPAIAANGVTGTMLVNKDVTSLNALLGKTAAGATVNVNASTMSNAYLTILSGNISKIDEITSLALTSAQSAEEIANLLTEAVAAIANGTGMDQSKLGNLGAGASAIAANGITGTLAIDSTVANLDALLGKTSAALATVNVDASGFDGDGKSVLASNGTKIDSIVDLALADSEDASEIAVLLSKVAAESAVVDATDMDYTQFNAIAAAIGKISDDGFSGTFTLTKDTIQVGAILAKTQLAAVVTVNANEMTSTQLDEVGANIAKVDFLINVTVTADASLSIESLEDLMASSTDVYVIATGMSAAQLNVVAEYAANVAANGITGDMFLTSDVLDSTLAALLGKTAASAVVTADATGMSSVHKDAMAANIGKVDKIYDLALASSENAGEITALLTKSVAVAAAGEAMAVANATGMDYLQLNALGASFAKLGADGITGAVALVSDVTDANLTNLFVKIALAADVRVDGTGMGASTLAILSANNAKVDSAFDYALTSSQNASQLSNLLGKSDVASATAVATGMDSVAGGQLATLADNHLKIRANGITGSVSITAGLTSTQLTNLLSRVDLSGSSYTAGTTVTIDAQGMSNSQLTSIASAIAGAGNTANQAAVFDIYNLSLTSAQSSSQLATLLNATVPGEASVNASSMSSAQLAALCNAPAAIDLITGSFTITADLTAAQIAAIMGNVSTTAVPTIDPTGMSPEQQNAVYNNALLVARTSSVVTTGNTFVVEVNVSGLSKFAVGAQVRVVYDSSRLAFVADPDGNGEPNYGGTDMPTQIFMSQTSNSVTFATGVDIEGDGVGVKTGNAARLTFRATVPFCPDDNLVWLSTSGFTNRLTTADAVPQSIPFTATNFVRIGSLNNLQLTGTPSGNSDVAADAGTVLGAAFTEPTVTAANSCSAVSVVRTITLPGGSTPTSWPSHFPVGVTSVNWTSTDEAGNVASNTTTYTVQNYQLATADVNLIATINPATSFNQVMRVRMSSGDVVSATVAFAGNNGAVMDIQVPIRDDYTCMAIKDAAHTLTDVQSLSVSGTKYATSGIYELVSGDANDDDLVDILDFGAFVADRGAGKTPASRSNYNRDIFVNSADYSYIGINFLQMGDVCGSGYNGGAPLTRITVKELRRRGLGEFAVADVNHDGWVDEEDLALVMSGQVPGFTPADEPTIHEDTAW